MAPRRKRASGRALATTYAAIVGQVLVLLRRERAIRQTEVASAVGVGQSTWSRIETGQSAVSVDQLARAATLFGVAPGEILARADASAAALEADGITVHRRRGAGGKAALALLGAAALGLLIAGILRRR